MTSRGEEGWPFVTMCDEGGGSEKCDVTHGKMWKNTQFMKEINGLIAL